MSPRAKALMNNKEAMKYLVYLYDRWSDEHEYEDWAGYVNAAKMKVEPHVDKFLTFQHKPKQLSFMVDGKIYKIKFKFTARSISLELLQLN